MHDITDLEARGVVTIGIVTELFRDGAEAQCRTLGFDPAVVYVAHPIQDRTDAELRRLAEEAFEAVLQAVTSSAS
jgi:hypothetical protein